MDKVAFVFAFGLTLHFTSVLMRVAPKLGLLDQPGGRKRHQGRVPLVGGLAIFLGFVFAILVLQQPLGGLRAFIAGCAMVMIVGVLDDLHELSSGARFVVQITAALCMVYVGDVRLADLGHLLAPGEVATLGWWAVPLTVFAVVGVINALNMIDGVDGLAGTLTGIALGAMALLAAVDGRDPAVNVILVLLLCLLAFLVFNLRFPWQPRARVFLGDGGSMFLGFALAWFFVDLSQGAQRAFSPVTALWIFAVPLIDTVTQMTRRMLRGKSPFAPDREHVHHLLLGLGLGPGAVVVVMGTMALLLAGVGIAGTMLGWPEHLLFYGFLALFGMHLLGMQLAWRRRCGAAAADSDGSAGTSSD